MICTVVSEYYGAGQSAISRGFVRVGLRDGNPTTDTVSLMKAHFANKAFEFRVVSLVIMLNNLTNISISSIKCHVE